MLSHLPAFTHKLFHLIFCPVDEEQQGSGWVGAGQPAMINPPQDCKDQLMLCSQTEGPESLAGRMYLLFFTVPGQ